MTSKRLLTETAKVLLKAADLIEERGHCKGRLMNEAGELCILGATNLAIYDSPHCAWDWEKDIYIDDSPLCHKDIYSRVFMKLRAVLNRNPVSWNDERERTAEEVVFALREAALMEDEYA